MNITRVAARTLALALCAAGVAALTQTPAFADSNNCRSSWASVPGGGSVLPCSGISGGSGVIYLNGESANVGAQIYDVSNGGYYDAGSQYINAGGSASYSGYCPSGDIYVLAAWTINGTRIDVEGARSTC
ncbi:hypothetical protein [Catenulispora pinisilvae]|uniref:hypothetical protein n=1 Tax=Catenulispora pinisilvae TaxID=2705253 RepID=UPI0018920A21|nr:hypothetical protein [Catenulispora pinisilvae]